MNKTGLTQTHKAHAGFNLVEIVLVVAVLAILFTMMVPSFIQFLDRKDKETELLVLQDIEKALKVFAERYNRLPDDDVDNAFCDNDADGDGSTSWAECLALVSNLSPEEILTDTWGEPRTYISFASSSEQLLGTTVPMMYATVIGTGSNKAADGTGSPLPDDGADPAKYEAVGHADWWSEQCTALAPNTCIQLYQQLSAPGDDYIVKYADRDLKLTRYQTTLERLRRITEALEQYATSRYNQAILSNETDAEKKIFFPLSENNGNDSSANYGTAVVAEMVSNGGFAESGSNDNRVENGSDSGSVDARREEMINLMRLLGLPDDHCCNAMVRVDDTAAGVLEEMPLYYYSNPRPLQGATCLATTSRAGVTDDSPLYMPARASVEAYACP